MILVSVPAFDSTVLLPGKLGKETKSLLTEKRVWHLVVRMPKVERLANYIGKTRWMYMQIKAVFQVSDTMVSDIVHQYSVYLDIFFKKAMPNPTKQEVLRRYPQSFIEKHGHGRIAIIILDCCDQEMEDPRFRNLHSVLYSLYHAQTGAKFGVGCTPIGVVPHPWCSEGYPSSVSDPNLECAKIGVQVSRPTTMRNKQQQQSRGETEKIQTVVNTRIFIENVNRQDMLSDMMKIGFITANFKPAFLHGYNK
eukprot:scaffold43752_cov51-Attheya_sp.AAC.6